MAASSARRLRSEVVAALSHLRCFRLKATRVKVLPQDPSAFHRLLVAACSSARRRVSLSALYFGTGGPEAEILAALHGACRQSRELQVRIIMDGARGRRWERGHSSLSALQPLVDDFPERVRVSTWDDLPQRPHWMMQLVTALSPSAMFKWLGVVAEITAVYHIKVFAIDNLVVLSGANLSSSYFTNRVDRYVAITDRRFAAWQHDVVNLLGSETINLNQLPATLWAHCADDLPRTTRRRWAADRRVALLFPAAQLGDLLRLEEDALAALLERRAARARVGFATVKPLSQCPGVFDQCKAQAYFNPPADIIRRLAEGRARILAPSTSSHGFANATDVRRNVPKAYQLIARDFVTASRKRARIFEWHDDHRSFHAKGIWLWANDKARRHTGRRPRHAQFLATLIGSSNCNLRARLRDLELSFVLATSNRRLTADLASEWSSFVRRTTRPTTILAEPKQVPLWVLVFRSFINTFL